jgi:hypothetical protein
MQNLVRPRSLLAAIRAKVNDFVRREQIDGQTQSNNLPSAPPNLPDGAY